MGPDTVKIRLTGEEWKRTPEVYDFKHGDVVDAKPVEGTPGKYMYKGFEILTDEYVPDDDYEANYADEWAGELIPDIPFKSNWSPVGVAVEDLIVPLTDEINPEHYQFPGKNGPVQVIDITKHLGFLEGNVIKYVARAGRKTKNPLTDLLKAQKYLGLLIEKTEEENR